MSLVYVSSGDPVPFFAVGLLHPFSLSILESVFKWLPVLAFLFVLKR